MTTDYQVPTAVLGTSVTANPQSIHQETTTDLAAAGTWVTEFDSEYSPLFDVHIYAEGSGGTLYAETRQSSSGTYRRVTGSWNITAAQLFVLTGLRLPGTQVRFTYTSDAATTVFDAQIYNRSQ